jgi:hypothetical protein
MVWECYEVVTSKVVNKYFNILMRKDYVNLQETFTTHNLATYPF